MDTRLKKYSFIRAILFIIVIGVFTGFIISSLNLIDSGIDSNNIFMKGTYFESNEITDELYDVLMPIKKYIYDYKNEDYIRSGEFLSRDHSEYYYETKEYFTEFIDKKVEETMESSDGVGLDVSISDYFDQGRFIKSDDIEDDPILQEFYDEYGERLEKLAENQMEKRLTEFKNLKEKIESIDEDEFIFYGTNGRESIYNEKDLDKIKDKRASLYISRDGIITSKELNNSKIFDRLYSTVKDDLVEDIDYVDNQNQIYLAMTDEYLDEELAIWNHSKANSKYSIQYIVLYGCLTILSFLGLAYFTGKTEDGEIQLNIIDRIYTDINLIICFALIISYFFIVGYIYNDMGMDNFTFENIPLLSITATISSIGLLLVLSLVRHLKNSSFVKHSLTYKIFSKIFGGIYGFFKGLYEASSLGKKISLILIIYPLALAVTFFIFPVTIIFAIILALRKVQDFEKIQDGVKKIKDGDLSHKIKMDSRGEFKNLADDINEIGEGLKNAVDNELKSERHRSELITNVSHDIRTPLTSIITYVDLLKNEDDPEKIKEYITVLDTKSERLKQLTDDLFEASKLTSGNIPVNMEKIDLVSLITQGLGEIHDQLEENQLTFVYDFPEEIFIEADGELLWRALDNLLSNIFKYGLKGSRVYIDIEEKNDIIRIIIKNISAYELNISAEELMERFKRGDESRTSEGSGLGLSIVQSLVEVQGGKFKIEIDGDLFKSIIEMPRCQDKE